MMVESMAEPQLVDLATLLEHEIPEGRQSLIDSHTNLARVADYCEGNYLQAPKNGKNAAFQETKNYTIQSLASVAYQINTLAYNFLHMLDLQTDSLSQLESAVHRIAQLVAIHQEKVARREIGVLTTNKANVKQIKITHPAVEERPLKYVRRPVDYTLLDDLGHGIQLKVGKLRAQRDVQKSSEKFGKNAIRTSNINVVNPFTSSSSFDKATDAPKQCGRNHARSTSCCAASVGVHPFRPESVGAPPNIGVVRPSSTSLSSTTSANSGSQYMQGLAAVQRQHSVPATGMPTTQGTVQRYRTTSTGSRGERSEWLPDWVPRNYIEKVIALYDYTADKDDELTFPENAVIYVLKKNSDGWWEGVFNGITGLFPGNYVEPCM
ncbi:unnamed protein product [Cyprideis torosa]|uniref:Uncharacterized protein n=1 Tax=Cyprideis torosa TaxID=163714 RepID=A0A7R8W2Z7_9CRUS|nr:unnamed protein product [Cyprideis torosa]CAG0882511.1 unnamed protein product [Cyprideis torosa]